MGKGRAINKQPSNLGKPPVVENNNFKFGYENEPHYVLGIKESLLDNVDKYNIDKTTVDENKLSHEAFHKILDDYNVNQTLFNQDKKFE